MGGIAGAGMHFGFGILVALLRLERRAEKELSGGEERKWSGREKGRNGMDGKGKGKMVKVEEEQEEGMRERVEGAWKRAEGAGLDAHGEWGERKAGGRRKERGRAGERGRRGVMTTTILEEESSSEMGF